MRGYTQIKQIGSGATANVWKAEKDGEDFALKIYKGSVDRMNQMENVMNELNFTSKVGETYAIAPIEAFVSSQTDGQEQ